jgi:hypothetical protein
VSLVGFSMSFVVIHMQTKMYIFTKPLHNPKTTAKMHARTHKKARDYAGQPSKYEALTNVKALIT